MFKNKLKRLCAVTLAGMMVMSVSACSTSKSAEKNSVSKAEQASEATTEAAKDDTTADYVASGVELPDNFENMIYPIEALMLQNYSKGIHTMRMVPVKKSRILSGFLWQHSLP